MISLLFYIYLSSAENILCSQENCQQQNVTCATTNDQCTIACFASSSHSCSKAVIYGQEASKLTIQCNQYHSCLNFVVFCPPHNESNGAKNCVIQGDDSSVHTNLELYVMNGFKDIDLSNYVSDVESNSSLFCGHNYSESCVIDNTYNCRNQLSPCYLSETFNSVKPTLEHTIESTSNSIAGNDDNIESTVEYDQTTNANMGYYYLLSVVVLIGFCMISLAVAFFRKINRIKKKAIYCDLSSTDDSHHDTDNGTI
eukprot:319835_1